MKLVPRIALAPCLALFLTAPAFGQAATDEQTQAIIKKLGELNDVIAKVRKTDAAYFLVADVEVYAKAAEWILRHNEFYQPAYAQNTLITLDTGLARGNELLKGNAPWRNAIGKTIRGYRSAVDESVQPYAVTLPNGRAALQVEPWADRTMRSVCSFCASSRRD